MKAKIIILSLFLLVLCGCGKTNNLSTAKKEVIDKTTNYQQEKNNYVSYNGKLKLSDNKIVNEYNEEVQLKGISSHGLQWYGNLITDENINTLKNEWNTNVFRLAMYTNESGYISNPSIYNDLVKYIDMIIENDMYVIVDWHILSDGNPNTYVNESIDFFDKISSKYKNSPNIIYEICNEPNNTSWKEIKKYADKVIPVIRKNTNSIIIVGTNTWDQDILDPLNDPIKEENIMYALHFYADTHRDFLRDRLKKAIDNKLPIFVSEFGTTSADGNGNINKEETIKWIDLLNEYNVSYINWSLSNKNEASAILKENKSMIEDENLTKSGIIIKELYYY